MDRQVDIDTIKNLYPEESRDLIRLFEDYSFFSPDFQDSTQTWQLNPGVEGFWRDYNSAIKEKYNTLLAFSSDDNLHFRRLPLKLDLLGMQNSINLNVRQTDLKIEYDNRIAKFKWHQRENSPRTGQVCNMCILGDLDMNHEFALFEVMKEHRVWIANPNLKEDPGFIHKDRGFFIAVPLSEIAQYFQMA